MPTWIPCIKNIGIYLHSPFNSSPDKHWSNIHYSNPLAMGDIGVLRVYVNYYENKTLLFYSFIHGWANNKSDWIKFTNVSLRTNIITIFAHAKLTNAFILLFNTVWINIFHSESVMLAFSELVRASQLKNCYKCHLLQGKRTVLKQTVTGIHKWSCKEDRREAINWSTALCPPGGNITLSDLLFEMRLSSSVYDVLFHILCMLLMFLL